MFIVSSLTDTPIRHPHPNSDHFNLRKYLSRLYINNYIFFCIYRHRENERVRKTIKKMFSLENIFMHTKYNF